MQAFMPEAGARLPAAVRGPAALRPAGVFRRLVALGVDLLLIWALLRLGRLAGAPLAAWPTLEQAFGYTWALVVPAAYFVLAHGSGGETLGKRLVRVRVVGTAGEPIGYPRALARLLISLVLPVLGHLLAAVRRDRRALHDLLAGTRVVRASGANRRLRGSAMIDLP